MKQAAKMQQQMEALQGQLAERTVEVTVGGGAIKVIAKCDGSVHGIQISPEAVDPEDIQMLEDMVLTGVNQALQQAKDVANQEMGQVSGGLGLPGLG